MAIPTNLRVEQKDIVLDQNSSQGIRFIYHDLANLEVFIVGNFLKLIIRNTLDRDLANFRLKTYVTADFNTADGTAILELTRAMVNALGVGNWVYQLQISSDNFVTDGQLTHQGKWIVRPSTGN